MVIDVFLKLQPFKLSYYICKLAGCDLAIKQDVLSVPDTIIISTDTQVLYRGLVNYSGAHV